MVIAFAKYFELIYEFTPSLMIFQQQIWQQLDIYRYFNIWPVQWAPMPGLFYATQDTGPNLELRSVEQWDSHLSLKYYFWSLERDKQSLPLHYRLLRA